MTIQTIINQVRWCIDEETGYSDVEDTYMDNIIKAKISDALRWCILYGDGSLLGGSDESGEDGYVKDYEITVVSGSSIISDDISYEDGVITLPSDFLKTVRVRNMGHGDTHTNRWHRAITNPISEDSEEYLMLFDDTAKPTTERPQVALIEKKVKELELYPVPESSDKVQLTIALDPEIDNTSSVASSTVSIPPKIKYAFLYYLAFLVLSAYNDISKANQMLAIAKMELGTTQTES